jgi:hypothetical protein
VGAALRDGWRPKHWRAVANRNISCGKQRRAVYQRHAQTKDGSYTRPPVFYTERLRPGTKQRCASAVLPHAASSAAAPTRWGQQQRCPLHRPSLPCAAKPYGAPACPDTRVSVPGSKHGRTRSASCVRLPCAHVLQKVKNTSPSAGSPASRCPAPASRYLGVPAPHFLHLQRCAGSSTVSGAPSTLLKRKSRIQLCTACTAGTGTRLKIMSPTRRRPRCCSAV